MFNIEINIFIPLIPLYRNQLHHKDYIDGAINEILDLNQKLEFQIEKFGVLKPTIALIADYDSEHYSSLRDALNFRAIINTNSNLLKEFLDRDYSEEMSVNEQKSYFETSIATEFEYRVFCFLILSQIAKPGSIKSSKGDIYINGKKRYDFDSFISIHRESLDNIKEIKWPVYKNLSIADVWSWYNEHKFSFSRASKCQMERGINSFTYLFKENLKDIVLDLIWSLVGIEALYCSGKEALSEQIFKKTQIFLGEIVDYKKKLKQMYDFRSRLIHGDLDIPPNNLFEDPNSFVDQLYDSTILAVAILTATLQKMVYENKRELNFRYTLD